MVEETEVFNVTNKIENFDHKIADAFSIKDNEKKYKQMNFYFTRTCLRNMGKYFKKIYEPFKPSFRKDNLNKMSLATIEKTIEDFASFELGLGDVICK